MKTPNASIREIFAKNGPLEKFFPGYQPREEQMQMAEAVLHALVQPGKLMVEAGTGTGKTFAYSVPALLSKKKVVLSTATKNLQDQIAKRDLPALLQALQIKASVQLLKGRQNYVCLERLQQSTAQLSFQFSKEIPILVQIQEWAKQTKTGDREELVTLGEKNSAIWQEIDARGERCLGSSCKKYNDCFITQMRASAEKADILVVNHALFFTDLSIKERTSAKENMILPAYDAVIFDEAHSIYDTATEYFGHRFSSSTFTEWSNEAQRTLSYERIEEREKKQAILEQIANLHLSIPSWFQELPYHPDRQAFQAKNLSEEKQVEAFSRMEAMKALAEKIKKLKDSTAFQNLASQLLHMQEEWAVMMEQENHSSAPSEGSPTLCRILEWRGTIATLKALPLHVAPQLTRLLFSQSIGFIFTSATLRVHQNFQSFKERIGIQSAEERVVASSFNYRQQVQLYIPKDMPEPGSPGFSASLGERLIALCNYTQGGAFCLFTSIRMLQEQASILKEKLPFPILVQGEAPVSVLLKKFTEHGSAVLLGAHRFWEGVDVKGQALRLVVMDKLPFPSPSDPLLAARIHDIERIGKSGFSHFMLPDAITALRQGFGRLIRDSNDHGVVAILDVRLHSKSYGKQILRSLPPTRPLYTLEAEH